jgi:hypothetical protein
MVDVGDPPRVMARPQGRCPVSVRLNPEEHHHVHVPLLVHEQVDHLPGQQRRDDPVQLRVLPIRSHPALAIQLGQRRRIHEGAGAAVVGLEAMEASG